MIKILILLNFIAFSIQIKNCDYSIKVCKSCKGEYKLINSIYPYQIKCVNEEEYARYGIQDCGEGQFWNENVNACKSKDTLHCMNYEGLPITRNE